MASFKKIMEKVLGEQLSTKVRHGVYSLIRTAVMKFTPRERGYDSTVVTDEIEEVSLGGAGERARYGGTKPMYEYVDTVEKRWLYKKAVNCVGFRKREGAYLTEAGSKLQEIIEPGTGVRAFAKGIDAHGFGSFQQKVDLPPREQRIDLFKWQKNEAGHNVNSTVLASLMPQIMREHTTDWLLCNFDTKGENFLVDVYGIVRGIDKEQAFSYINNPRAATMSKDFQPNPNNTLYNVIFTKYAQGETDIDIDLNACMRAVQKMEAMPKQAYMNLYKDFLDEKFRGRPQDAPERQAMEQKIYARKENLREEYGNFFTGLIQERHAALAHNPQAQQALLEQYQLSAPGQRFEFTDRRPAPVISRRAMSLDDLPSAAQSRTRAQNSPQPPAKPAAERQPGPQR